MKRGIVRTDFRKTSAGALSAAMLFLAMAAAPRAAWGQWSTGSNGIIYYSGGNVGIGATTPADTYTGFTTLAVRGSTNGGIVEISNANADADNTQIGQIMWADRNNTNTDKTVAQIYSFVSGATANNRGSLIAFGTKADGGGVSERMRITNSGNIGIGTVNPQYLLSVKGTIGAEEVIVTNTGWSDYVFRPGYHLRSLREIGAYIQANHHLPDIPSEGEVKEKGVSVGDMQSKLLAKIEELTLHMIQQDERNSRLERQNLELQRENRAIQDAARALQNRIAKLESK